METGQVNTWVADRGFGFIQCDMGGADVFMHVRAIAGPSESVAVGTRVEFTVETDHQGRARATRVFLLE